MTNVAAAKLTARGASATSGSTLQRESLGPALSLGRPLPVLLDLHPRISFIRRSMSTPYAFGDCLVNSLYAAYEDAHQGFAERYLNLLRAGGTFASPRALGAVRTRCRRPGFLVEGPRRHPRLYRRTGSTRLIARTFEGKTEH